MYTVAVSDQTARDNMKQAVVQKLTKRWDHQDDGEDSDDSANKHDSSSTIVGGSSGAATGHRGPSPFLERPGQEDDNHSTFRRPSTESSRREGQVEEVRSLLRQESTHGRRRKAVPGDQPVR